MTRTLLRTPCLAALPLTALAHDGHGATAVHWHASDTWGFIVTIALVGAALWFARRK
ncbi:MAG: hypothetical protein IV105_21145 [Rhizobacter sp.]|nr:hypothetical protein [Rhizobacter sp.]